MPGFLLHVGAAVQCAHGGLAQPTAPNPRVRVMGQPIVTLGAPFVVAGCAFPPPPAGNGPCVTANWVMGATRVRSMGQPVLLQDSHAVCTPTGTPLTIGVVQTRVKGM
ncbi:MAG: hypothetical protein IPM39_19715 [Chloroflexi bacterium]|nr:hypothetical protein [Chloroflexota bacterium]